jgi:hypothetical protein
MVQNKNHKKIKQLMLCLPRESQKAEERAGAGDSPIYCQEGSKEESKSRESRE